MVVDSRYRCSTSLLALSLGVTAGLLGCADKNSGGNKAPSGPNPYTNMTGNWQVQATPTSGGAPFVALSGNFFEEATDAVAHSTTASLLAQSTSCYAGAGTVPLRGNVQRPTISLSSFSVDGQVLNLTAQKDEAAQNFTGTYSISGGCANGNKGNLTGVRYSPLTGTFSGPLAGDATKSATVTVTQQTLGTSGGTFLVSGSATFTGFACFTRGSLVPAPSYVSGSSVVLVYTSNDLAGSQITLLGTFTPSANSVSLSSFTVVGGSCAGSYGGATLPLKS